VENELRRPAVERLLAALRETKQRREPAVALGEEVRLEDRAVASVMEHSGEIVALTAFNGGAQ
jgi:hypothetical protein